MTYKPKKDTEYWMINSRWQVKLGLNGGANKSKDRISVGNCFRTKKQAEKFAEQIRAGRFEQLHPIRGFFRNLKRG